VSKGRKERTKGVPVVTIGTSAWKKFEKNSKEKEIITHVTKVY
jgi:hypothetical protein